MYRRARWYNAQKGRFNRLDPFFGNLDDPQSLRKYAYVHGDPIQGIDPTGLEFSLKAQVQVQAGSGELRGVDAGAKIPTAAGAEAVAAKAIIQHTVINSAARGGAALSPHAGRLFVDGPIGLGLWVSLLNAESASKEIQNVFELVKTAGGGGTNRPPAGGGGADNERKSEQHFTPVAADPLRRASWGSAIVGPDTRGASSEFSGHPSWWPNIPNISGRTPPPLGRGWQRGHLIAGSPGGPGLSNYQNMVPLTQSANHSNNGMSYYERIIRDARDAGQCVLMFTIPVYNSSQSYVPDGITMFAMSDRGTLVNPAEPIDNSF